MCVHGCFEGQMLEGVCFELWLGYRDSSSGFHECAKYDDQYEDGGRKPKWGEHFPPGPFYDVEHF